MVSGAVEGLIDEAVLRGLLTHVGAAVGAVHGKHGKDDLRHGLRGYNSAARWAPWVVLVDLNRDEACAPPLRRLWLPDPAPGMCFRIVVRKIEAWLLADRERIARFLGVPLSRVPPSPEAVDDPKQLMVELARRSRRREIREDMVPRPGSGRQVGPAYTSRLVEFVERHWRPGVAARSADSLRRCLKRLDQLVRGRPPRSPSARSSR